MNPALLVFAKQPIPGKVKTRLAHHCGDQAAAYIAQYLLEQTISLVTRAWQGPVVLYCWPNPDHDLFRRLAEEYNLTLTSQCPGSLGEKMYTALLAGCDQHGAAAVIGADIPHCPENVINQAYTLLSAGKAVIGPASDGGYYLLGVTKPDKKLFKNIKWGSESVFTDTMIRAQESDILLNHLPVLRDIDDWQDLLAAAQMLPGLKQYLEQISRN